MISGPHGAANTIKAETGRLLTHSVLSWGLFRFRMETSAVQDYVCPSGERASV